MAGMNLHIICLNLPIATIKIHLPVVRHSTFYDGDHQALRTSCARGCVQRDRNFSDSQSEDEKRNSLLMKCFSNSYRNWTEQYFK